MTCLDLTLPTPEENLALDEALLEGDQSGGWQGTLRFWESPRPFVVIGYAGKVSGEVNVTACRKLGVPILRRCSGGGTVLQGPGCLNYALILPLEQAGPLSTITSTNRFVMERHRDLIGSLLGRPVTIEGVTDLVVAGRKFSGNAQRRRQDRILFHGTFLLDFDLERMETLLLLPSRRPEYRGSRTHADFLVRLALIPEEVKRGLREVWGAQEAHCALPSGSVARLVETRYGTEEWNWKR